MIKYFYNHFFSLFNSPHLSVSVITSYNEELKCGFETRSPPLKVPAHFVLMLTGAQLCFEVCTSLEELKKEKLKKGSLQSQI